MIALAGISIPQIRLLFIIECCAIGWISNNAVEPSPLHEFGKGHLPVENIDSILCVLVEEEHLFVLIEIWTDERVAALDVSAKIGEDALAFLQPVTLNYLFCLAFEYFQQQREFGHFYSLTVDVYTVNVV